MKQLNFDPLNIVVCGIGGQGNVLASEVLGSAMTDRGYHVAVGETYGASQRGGSVMSHVRVSADQELSVLIPSGEAHMIIGFEPLETLRIARKYANNGTTIVYDPRPVYPLGVLQGSQSYPSLDEITAAIQGLSAGFCCTCRTDRYGRRRRPRCEYRAPGRVHPTPRRTFEPGEFGKNLVPALSGKRFGTEPESFCARL